MIDFLWFLNAPFWQKMFWACIVVGVTTFMYFYMIILIPEIKNDVKDLKTYLKVRGDIK